MNLSLPEYPRRRWGDQSQKDLLFLHDAVGGDGQADEIEHYHHREHDLHCGGRNHGHMHPPFIADQLAAQGVGCLFIFNFRLPLRDICDGRIYDSNSNGALPFENRAQVKS